MTDAPFTETHRETLLDLRQWVHSDSRVAIDAALAQIARLDKAGRQMAEELHAAINEPMYSGTRADWMFRAQVAESQVETLQTENNYLKEGVRQLVDRQRKAFVAGYYWPKSGDDEKAYIAWLGKVGE